jgi:phosphoserine phosphatase
LELLVSPVPGQGSEDYSPGTLRKRPVDVARTAGVDVAVDRAGSSAQQAADRLGRLHAPAFLVTMMTSLALNTTHTARARRATSVGQPGDIE